MVLNLLLFILLKLIVLFELVLNIKWLMCGLSCFNNGRCFFVVWFKWMYKLLLGNNVLK